MKEERRGGKERIISGNGRRQRGQGKRRSREKNGRGGKGKGENERRGKERIQEGRCKGGRVERNRREV